MNQFIAKRANPSTPLTISGHLRMSRRNPQRDLFAFTAGLPETNIIDQLVGTIVQSLLSLPGAPDFDSMLNKPLNQERCFVFASPETVKHKDQKHIKFFTFRHCAHLDNSIALAG